MKILHKVTLPNKKTIMVIDEGGTKVTVLVKSNGSVVDMQVTRWNWEEKLPKLLDLTKEELNL